MSLGNNSSVDLSRGQAQYQVSPSVRQGLMLPWVTLASVTSPRFPSATVISYSQSPIRLGLQSGSADRALAISVCQTATTID
jgi:hypothetical protein